MSPAGASPLPSQRRVARAAAAAARVVRGQPARPALAPHDRPLCHPGQRDHAAADAGAPGDAALRRVARGLAGPREPRRGAARRRAAALAGPRLQQPGAAPAGVRRARPSPRRRTAGRRSCRAPSTACARSPASARTRRAPCWSSPTTTTWPRWTPTCAASSRHELDLAGDLDGRRAAGGRRRGAAARAQPRLAQRAHGLRLAGADGARHRHRPAHAPERPSRGRGGRSAPACCAACWTTGRSRSTELALALGLPLDETADLVAPPPPRRPGHRGRRDRERGVTPGVR